MDDQSVWKLLNAASDPKANITGMVQKLKGKTKETAKVETEKVEAPIVDPSGAGRAEGRDDLAVCQWQTTCSKVIKIGIQSISLSLSLAQYVYIYIDRYFNMFHHFLQLVSPAWFPPPLGPRRSDPVHSEQCANRLAGPQHSGAHADSREGVPPDEGWQCQPFRVPRVDGTRMTGSTGGEGIFLKEAWDK